MTDGLTNCQAVQQGGSPQHPREEAPQEEDSEESIEAVENLLESYFMQIDSLYDRLVSMGAPCIKIHLVPAWQAAVLQCCGVRFDVGWIVGPSHRHNVYIKDILRCNTRMCRHCGGWPVKGTEACN